MVIKSRLKNYTLNFVEDFKIPLKNEKNADSFFIVDSNVNDLYIKKLNIFLPSDKYIVIEANENNKTIDKCKEIIEILVDRKIRRNQRLIAIGGGVIQDITSFTASIIYRGIDWSFFPTTLLAQADSCIGSKTSINLVDIKNIIGNFYPPREIFLDVNFLYTLSDDDIKSGIGEILHFYFYSNTPLIHQLMNSYTDLISNPKLLLRFIKESLKIKKSVIEFDEFDKGERNKFNYGHTFGHAIETITNYKIKHGQAVCIGMDIANFVSLSLGKLGKQDFEFMHKILLKNMPVFHLGVDMIEDYFMALSKDKKNIGENLGCILSGGLGVMQKAQIPINDKLKKIIVAYFKTYGIEKHIECSN